MMKSRYIMTCLFAMAGLFLASCEKDADTDNNVPEIKIALCVDGQSTRATDTEDATAGEAKISSVTAYMCKADGNHSDLERKLSVFDPATNFLSIKVPDMEGDWLVYIVANAPSGLTIDDSSYDNFISSLSAGASVIDDCWKSDHFMMFNRYDATEAGVEVSVDTPVPYTVNLQRVAVKVVPESDDFIDFAPYHTLIDGTGASYAVSSVKIDGAALFNCVNSFYLLPQFSATQLVTPSSAASYSMTDGYYDNNPASLTFVEPDETTGEFPPMYCIENNSPLYSVLDPSSITAVTGTKMKGRVTAVVFRAQVSMADGFDAGGDILDPLTVDPTTGTWTRSGYTDSPRTFYKYKNTYFADFNLLKTTYPSIGTDQTPSVLRSKGVQVFENGHMYYTYYITDTDGNYSVTRNTCYRLKVNTISSFGDDVPCGGSGYVASDPIKSKHPSIGVTLKISGWDDAGHSDLTL